MTGPGAGWGWVSGVPPQAGVLFLQRQSRSSQGQGGAGRRGAGARGLGRRAVTLRGRLAGGIVVTGIGIGIGIGIGVPRRRVGWRVTSGRRRGAGDGQRGREGEGEGGTEG